MNYIKLSLILVVLDIVIIGVLLVPGFNQLATIGKEVQQKAQRLGLLTNKLNDLKTIDTAQIASMADRSLLAIPSINHYLAFFDTIASIASQNGVNVTDLQLNPGSIETAGTLSTTANFKGSFDAIRQMVDSLENKLPIVQVSNLSFDDKISTESASLKLLKVNLQLNSYWVGLPKSLGRVDSPLEKLTKEDYATIGMLDKYQLTTVPMGTNVEGGNTVVGRENPFPI